MGNLTTDLAKAMIKEAAYQYCNLRDEQAVYLILKEAFEAGMQAATYNGVPGIPDAPNFDDWIRIKAFEEI